MKSYKWTAGDGPVYGTGTYDQSGAWMTVRGPLVPCKNGWHSCTREQLPEWCGTELWEVEIDGEGRNCGDKTLSRRIRFVRQLRWDCADMVSYAQWCADRAAAHAAATSGAYGIAIAQDAARYARYASATFEGVANDTYVARAAVEAANDAKDAANAANDCAIESAYSAERQAQLEWIEKRIGETLR